MTRRAVLRPCPEGHDGGSAPPDPGKSFLNQCVPAPSSEAASALAAKSAESLPTAASGSAPAAAPENAGGFVGWYPHRA